MLYPLGLIFSEPTRSKTWVLVCFLLLILSMLEPFLVIVRETTISFSSIGKSPAELSQLIVTVPLGAGLCFLPPLKIKLAAFLLALI